MHPKKTLKMPICKFCNTDLSSNSALNSHQKRTKYCLEIQKAQGLTTNEIIYQCLKCKHQFTMKEKYDHHINKCTYGDIKLDEIKLLQEEIIGYKVEIATLNEKVIGLVREHKSMITILKDENMALKNELAIERKQSTNLNIHRSNLLAQKSTTINNTNNGKIVLTTPFNAEERIRKGFANFTVKDCKNAVTMAKFVARNVITDENGVLLYLH